MHGRGAARACRARRSAEVVGAGANGFEVRHSVDTGRSRRRRRFAAFARIGDWWSKDHTYSGDAAQLSPAASPRRLLCERLDGGGGIEHMRVAYVQPGERVVLTGGLGPLLFEATTGVMDVRVERIAGGLAADPQLSRGGLRQAAMATEMAPVVDQVLRRAGRSGCAPTPPSRDAALVG